MKRKEVFEYFGNPEKLRLEQGQVVMERRPKELDLTLSPSQKVTPADGNCLFHSLLDQTRYIPDLNDFASNSTEFRTKIISLGYSNFIQNNKLIWSYDPSLGTPLEWKEKMLQVGDEAALNLASNVLSVDIAVITAIRESSIHKGFGITVIKALERPKHEPLFLFLFSESDFFTPHYQSVRPITEDNVLATFLAASNERTASTIDTTGDREDEDGVKDRVRVQRDVPTFPPIIPCVSLTCSHTVIFGHHYDCQQFKDYKLEEDQYRKQLLNYSYDSL